jgi:D-cysteine desulfhydrase
MTAHPLLAAYPRLAAALPVAGLLQGSTPVQSLGNAAQVYLKRDDLTAAGYGGNKIRKLDFLLADAKARGAKEVLSFGFAGSNFVAATAWHGRRLGLHTIACLLPQVDADYIADNLSVGLQAGAELRLLADRNAIVRAAIKRSAAGLLRRGRLPVWIPPGGSSPLGTLGFVNAALELRAQIEAGVLPAPQRIYVAFSSMGTVAGLALGLELAGLPSSIVAVQVVDERFATAAKLLKLIDGTRRLLGRLDPALMRYGERAMERVEIRTEFFGGEYGRATPQTYEAIRRFTAASGARADTSYSGKALACLYHDLDVGRLQSEVALFWHTFNARALPPGVQRLTAQDVPEALKRYFG